MHETFMKPSLGMDLVSPSPLILGRPVERNCRLLRLVWLVYQWVQRDMCIVDLRMINLE